MSLHANVYLPLEQIAPMIFIVLSGWLAAELGWVPAVNPTLGTKDSLRLGMKSFSNFIFFFALPALLFYELAIFSFANLEWGFVVAVVLGHTVTWLMTLLGTVLWLNYVSNEEEVKRKRRAAQSMMTAAEEEEGKGILMNDPWSRGCMNALSTSHPSAVFLGIPLIQQLYGKEEVVYCALVSGIGKLTIVLLSICILEIRRHSLDPHYRSRASGMALLKITWKSFLNPITLPIVLGVLWSVTGFSFPAILETWLISIGQTTVGCALFAVGMSLYFSKNIRSDEWSEFLIIIVIKQFVCPLIVLGIAAFLPMQAQVRKVLYVLSLLPPSQVIFFIATEYHVGVSVISASILFGGVVAIPNILFSYTLLDLGPSRVFLPRDVNTEDVSLLQEIALIIGILSVVGALWTLLPFLWHLRTTLRSTASQLVSLLALSQMLFVVFQMFGQEGNVPAGTLCTLQGFGIQMFGATSNAYFLIIAVNLWGNCFNPSVSRLGAFLQHPLLVYFYHVLCWGYGVASALIILALGDYGSAGPWCWISSTSSEAEQFYFFYIPLASFAFISTVLLVYIHYIVSAEKGAFHSAGGVASTLSGLDFEVDDDEDGSVIVGGGVGGKKRRRRESHKGKGGVGDGLMFVGEETESLLDGARNLNINSTEEINPKAEAEEGEEEEGEETGNAWVRSGLKSKLLWKTRLYILSFIFIWVWGLANRLQQLITDDTLFILFLLHVFCTSAIGIVTFLIWGQTDYHWAFYKMVYDYLIWFWKRNEKALDRWTDTRGTKEITRQVTVANSMKLGRRRYSDESSESSEESEWDTANSDFGGTGLEGSVLRVPGWEEDEVTASDGDVSSDVATSLEDGRSSLTKNTF